MARKAINGYPEKSYYDNTVFKGITATNDPLNEGSFALITNFDITDSTKSIVPRKGYTTTTFTVDGTPVILSNKILTYRDPNIQKDIIIDLNKLNVDDDTLSKFAYTVDITQYNIENNLISSGHLITNYDYNEVVPILSHIINIYGYTSGISMYTNALWRMLSKSTIIGDAQLQPIRDKNGVIFYIKKLHYSDTYTYLGSTQDIEFNWWIKILYRPNATTVGTTTYTADTLVLSVIDTEQQTVNFLNRNLASSTSIIPDPIRTQESEGTTDSVVTDVNRPILLKNNLNAYMTNNLPTDLKTTGYNINVVPSFHLQKPSVLLSSTLDNPKWAYRFSITNSNKESGIKFFKTPWRTLLVDNTVATASGSPENPVIEQLDLKEGATEETFTYYVTTEGLPECYMDASAYGTPVSPPSFATIEGDIFSELVDNGTATNALYYYGNTTLATAYTMYKNFNNRLDRIILQDLDTSLETLFTDLRFIPQSSLTTEEHTTFSTRTKTFSTIPTLADGYIVTNSTVSAPILKFEYKSDYVNACLTYREFVADVKVKSKIKKIQLILVPFMYEFTYDTDGPDEPDAPKTGICAASIAGVYYSGLISSATDSPLGPITAWEDIVAIRKIKVFTSLYNEFYLEDVFTNFGNLNLKDINSVVGFSNIFNKYISITLYLKPYNDSMLSPLVDANYEELMLRNLAWENSSFIQSAFGTWVSEKDVIYIDEIDDENPSNIKNSTHDIVFEDRLIVWSGNKVYISEEGDYHYFTSKLKKEFPEEILKIISFKTILLVFTTQNLYAIYRVEIDTLTGTYTAEGNPETSKQIVWLQQPVLYNINPDRKYLDVIQVYNQMILFYSTEGQLYMIKPSTTIDSETQFAIQYFNKSANNILANYHDYITERLKLYNKLDINNEEDYILKDDVSIKILVDIDLIKIFYTVPNKITFILIYDVVYNRYTTYDTLSFTNINSLKHVEGGELYLTQHNDNTYLTLPITSVNDVDQNVDMHYVKMFKKEPIFTYIDSGNLNLNNHLKKRLRDLRIVIKNLDATKILYNAELLLDDTLTRPLYGPDFKVKMVNYPDSSVLVEKVPLEDVNELFGLNQTIGVSGDRTDINSYYLQDDREFFDTHALLKIETLNFSRLIEYNSSILGMGKVIRIRLQFISKGKYKLQSFGIIYKEIHV